MNTPIRSTGKFNVFNFAGTVGMIIDINGYYTQASLQELASRLAAAESAQATNTSGIATNTSGIVTNTADLAAKANTSDVYTKTETDAELAAKADAADVYTKTEIDQFGADAYGEVVRASGTLSSNRASFGNVVPSKRAGTGKYRLPFPAMPCSSPFPSPRPLIIADISVGIDDAKIRAEGFSCAISGLRLDYEVLNAAGTNVDSNFVYLVFSPTP